MSDPYRSHSKGLTLIDTVVSIGVFSLIAISVLSIVRAGIRATTTYRDQSVTAELADRYIEVARNLPYSQIGTQNGNPYGVLVDLPNATTTVIGGVSYKIYYAVSKVDDPADGTILAGTDPAPSDYKQVKVYIQNTRTGITVPFETIVSPLGLEDISSGGALSLQVFDSVGEPVPNASIHIQNSSTTPHIDVTRTTDAAGRWIEVGLPNSANSYHITATKSGYSTDQTYPITAENPNPTKPYSTVSNGQVTSVSFSIDKASDLTIRSVDQTCHPLNGVALGLAGTKLIGTPDVLKFYSLLTTNAQGEIILDPIEWDTYTPSISSPSYMIYGSSPIQQIEMFPDTSQVSTLVLGPATNHSLLIIVKDAATGNPLEGATVRLSDAGLNFDESAFTAGSVLYQEDWSGGSGQADITAGSGSKYYTDDGNIDVSTLPTGARLRQVFGEYVGSGTLVSSSFDTGTASTSYTTLTWEPPSQSASTSLSFQLAANDDNATWNFTGPDGTDATYYTTPGSTIHPSAAGNRYLRYKLFLASASTTTTPVLSNVTANYVSGCFSPGQAMFPSLQADDHYEVTVSLSGYATQSIQDIHVSGYNVLEIMLSQ